MKSNGGKTSNMSTNDNRIRANGALQPIPRPENKVRDLALLKHALAAAQKNGGKGQ
jgi:hypothetical protein